MEVAALKTATVVSPDEIGVPPHDAAPKRPREHRGPALPPNRQSPPAFPYVRIILLGCLLPVFTLAIEIGTHMCAGALFDPIPTAFHIFLVALVPTSSAATYCLAERATKHRRFLGYLNATAIGVALMYSIAFAPLMPLSLFAMLIMGMGLLPLSPALSLIGLLAARKHLRDVPGTGGDLPAITMPMAITALLLLVTPLQHFATYAGLDAVTHGGTTMSQKVGLWWLRSLGSKDALLDACYRNNGRGELSLVQLFGTVSAEEAQKVYYQVTGEAYNSQPAPQRIVRGRDALMFSRQRDASLGGEQVANRVPGLSLDSSRIDGKVNADAGTSYTEWTMVFKNVSSEVTEARAQIELPQGGVVSRLTLWINGEPREAAFGGRSQVRKAYQEIAVVQRRDPVLVTTSGPNRVLMQCFPVPANGEMKIRMGITAPLFFRNEVNAAVLTPRIVETNFAFAKRFKHHVALESDRPLTLDSAAKGTSLKFELSDEELQSRPGLPVSRAGAPKEVWTDDPTDPTWVIRQTLQQRKTTRPSRIAIVVDGSGAMAEHVRGLTKTLKSHSFGGSDTAIFFAGEEVDTWRGDRSEKKDASAWLRGKWWSTDGGRDNLAALEQAWDFTAAVPDGAIIWIHGTQPVLLRDEEALQQRIERDANRPRIYDLPIAAGANRILDSFSDYPAWITADTERTAAASLDRILTQLLAAESVEYIPVRDRIPRGELTTSLAQTDRHVARLWSVDEVDRIRFSGEEGSLDRATKLAIDMQLVTPISGAVVLERKEQYDRHGLTPVDESTVPTVPEPGIGALAASGIALLLGFRRRRPVNS